MIKDPHLTTLFLGGKPSEDILSSKAYTKFQENLSVPLMIQAIVYVPYKIITALVRNIDAKIPVENQFAHITLMTGKWKPNDSNTLLK